MENTMTWERWQRLSESERAPLRSTGLLTPQLIGLEGFRVEVTCADTGSKRRFWVQRSSGWTPCHIEMKLRTSRHGMSADRRYAAVRIITRKGF